MRIATVALLLCLSCKRHEAPKPDPAPRVTPSAEPLSATSAAPVRRKDQPVNGALWSKTVPESIPNAPVEGVIFGERFVPERVELHDRVRCPCPPPRAH